MASEKRLIDAKDFDLRVSEHTMAEVFPNWKELPEEVQDAVCKHGQFLRMLLETQPTVDAVEVVHGRWTREHTVNRRMPMCSECGRRATAETNYCPNCGAKMDGERKDNERKAD